MRREQPFRIAHLSDLHLTADDNASRSEPKLYGRLRGMNAAFRRVVASDGVRDANLVLVTGDVTDRGDLDAWRVFWAAIDGAGLRGRLLVVPGNHDVCCLGLRVPRPDQWKEDMERAAAGLRLGNQRTKLPWVECPDKRVAVFGLNSNKLANFSALTNAIGQISYYDLQAFASLLHKHRNVPVKIVALHHSPNIPKIETANDRGQPPMGPLDRLTMQMPEDQRRALRLLCVTHRVRLIVHGHIHQADSRPVNGIRIVGAPASTEPTGAPGRQVYRYYSYSVLGDGGRVTRRLESIPVA